jgi:hypothetical protein
VGTAVGASSLNLAGGSTLALQVTDWNGVAGTGYDSVDFGSIATSATSSNKLKVQVDTTGIVNFSESAHSFTIGTADAPPTGFSTDNWQVSTTGGFTGTGTWSLGVDGNNLVLSYTPVASGYGTWIAGFPGLSDATATGDPDGDGLANVLEYVLNSNPGNGSGMKLPAAAVSGANFTVSFVRRAESKGDTTQTLQYGPALPGATEVPVPASSSGIFTIIPDSPSAGLETVTATIPRGTNTQIFARLKATQP